MQLPFKPGMSVIEIGGGENPAFRPNVDIRPGSTVDMVADLNQPFPINDNSYDGVYSSYIIEHISWRKVQGFINELYRIVKPGGSVFIITANLLEQSRMVTDVEELTDREVCAVFGDQNYGDADWRSNAHYCGFSPASAINKFNAAGFINVTTAPHPNCKTDLIIEARKGKTMKCSKCKKAIPEEEQTAEGMCAACYDDLQRTDGLTLQPETWTKQDRQKAYDKDYFDGGKVVGGYAHEGYWDYPIHWNTARKIAAYNPESILELGAARGYILKKFEDSGFRVKGLEVSNHCYHTRAINDIVTWDITETPWPIGDQEFDLCFSIAVMEHIPEDKVEAITKEIQRTCKRALHGISFDGDVDDFDKTHTTLRDLAWWQARLPENHLVVDKEALEEGPPDPPLGVGDTSLKLNIGSFITMFHHNWINIDICKCQPFADAHKFKFVEHDVTHGLPCTNDSVDLIYTSHFLEHLSYEQGAKFLKDCYRAMKPGAVMRILVPNAATLIETYAFPDIVEELDKFDCLNSGAAAAPTSMSKLWNLMCAGHSALYDAETLNKTLKAAGFKNIERMAFRQSMSKQILVETIDMLPTISLFMDVMK